jgi:hypothetical protein
MWRFNNKPLAPEAAQNKNDMKIVSYFDVSRANSVGPDSPYRMYVSDSGHVYASAAAGPARPWWYEPADATTCGQPETAENPERPGAIHFCGRLRAGTEVRPIQ